MGAAGVSWLRAGGRLHRDAVVVSTVAVHTRAHSPETLTELLANLVAYKWPEKQMEPAVMQRHNPVRVYVSACAWCQVRG